MIKQIIRLAALFAGVSFLVGVSAYFTVVLLTKSEQTVIVPDLTDKHVTRALERLSELGLNIKVRDNQYSHQVARHHIIYQHPEPGLEIKTGRDVQLVISKGPREIPMPDLRGDTLDQARLVIEANELRLEVISETYADGRAADEIMSQYPPAGVMVSREAPVNLLVSRGPRPRRYLMPDLSGLTFGSAVMRLEKAGMSLGQVTSSVDQGAPINAVVSHQPPAGACITEGEPIDLVVNRKTKEGPYASARGGGARLFRYRLENGFLNRHIKVTVNCFGMSTDIYDRYQAPATEIWVLVPSRRDATVLLYEDRKLVDSRVFGGW